MTATLPDPFFSPNNRGEIMRSHSWELTPLGAAGGWSLQLQTIFNLILNAGEPMFILWGDEQIFLGNDAYFSVAIGVKPAPILGQPLKQCWPEMYREIAGELEAVWETGSAIFRDCQKLLKCGYFQTAYNPIFDETGKVVAVWGTLKEIPTRHIYPETSDNILERITDAFVALDRDFTYTYVNAEAARLLGYSRQELLGKQLWKDVFVAEADSPASQQMRRAMNEQTPLHLEGFSPVIDRYLEINAYPSEEGISIYFRDISERKKTEAQLRASEEFNRRIIESSTDCIKVLDLEGRLLSMNAGGQLLLEIDDLQSFLGRSWVEFWQGSDRAQAEQAIALARIGTNSRFQGYCPTQTDRPKWWDVIVTPIFGEGGQVEQILCLSRDITHLKQTEDALRTSEKLYRTLSDAVPDFIWSCDSRGQTEFVNSRWIEYTGLTLEELNARGLKHLNHPDDYPGLQQAWEDATRRGEPFEAELRYRRHDGVYRWFMARAVPLKDESGNVVKWIGTTTDIHQRKQAEAEREQLLEQLETERARTNAILQQMPAGVLIADAATQKLVLANRQVEQILGYSYPLEMDLRTETQNITFIGFHPDGETYRREDYPLLRSLRTGEVILGEEISILRADGHCIFINVNSAPIRDQRGEIVAAVAVFRDITFHRQAELALRRGEERFRALIEQAPDAVFIADLDGTYIDVNNNACHLLGYRREELIGKQVQDVIPPEDRPRLEATKQSLLLGNTHIGEWTLICRDRTPVPVEISTKILPDGRWQAFVRNITERKRTQEALRQSEERFRQMAENIEDVFWVAQMHDYRLLYVSPAYEKVWGYSCESLYANPYQWMETIHPEDRQKTQTAFTEQVLTGRCDLEFRIVRPDGSVRWIRDRGFAIPEADGQIRTVAGIAEDITERKQAEAALGRREEELRLITDAVPALIAYVDPDQRFRFVNRAYTDWFGHLPENIIGRHLADFIGETAYECMRPDVESALAGEPVTAEVWMPFQDGGPRYVRRQYIPDIARDGGVKGFYALITDITNLKRTEAALRQSEQQFRVAQELSLYGFTILKSVRDETGAIADFEWVYVNPKAAEALKRPACDLQGQRLLQVLPGNQFNTNLFHRYVQVVETGEPHDIEILYDADDIQGWFHNMAVKLDDGVAVSFSDISDRKRAEEALRASVGAARARAEELETLMEAVPAAIWIAQDPYCHQMSANLTAYELMRMSPGSVTTATPLDGRNPLPFKQQRNGKNVPPQELPMQKAGRTGQEIEGELEFIFDDGEIRYIYGKAVPLRDDHGQVRGVIGAFLDITERKQAEEALLASEERFRLATRAVTGIVYDWDLTTDSVYRSEGLRELIGIGPEEAPPDRDWWGERIHPEDLAVVQPQMLSILNEGEDRYSFEYRVLHEDGRWIDVWDRGYIIRDRRGRLLRVVGSTADISDRKRAEAEREQLLASERAAREEAEAANRIKDEFLAVLSHELRSPLNPILGWANLLRRQPTDNKIFHQGLTTIERNVKLQVQLIDDLLDVSRILRGKLSLNRSSVDLAAVILASMETVRLAAQAKSIEIKTHLDPQVGRVLGDSGRLQQIVWNLLSNAVKFSETDGRVDVYLERVANLAQIRVCDRGKGIKSEFLPHVFDYFRQEDGTTTRKFGGLGLGLAIVRYITEMHGGTVRAESKGEGQGATFTVNLPLLSGDRESLNPEKMTDSESVNGSSLRGIRVLIVEDEADTRNFLKLMLEQAGATVTAAVSAREGLEEFVRSAPDILVSDIGMPGMDGYQLIKQVRSLYRKPSDKQMPAIALTAYAGETDFEKAIAAGYNQHICKPVEPQRLIRAIQNWVSQSAR